MAHPVEQHIQDLGQLKKKSGLVCVGVDKRENLLCGPRERDILVAAIVVLHELVIESLPMSKHTAVHTET